MTSLKFKVVKFHCAAIFLLCLLFACKKPPTPEPKDDGKQKSTDRIMYIVNEGLFNQNNTTLTRYNITQKKTTNNYFEAQNGRKLGDTGNDIQQYGNKIYIVVNVSSQVEVINLSGQSIAQIPLFDGSTARQPRKIAFHEGKAFVSCFDGTVAVIDTATLMTTDFIEVGRNPEGLAVQNNRLYVANSGGLDAPNYDSTVSVVNLNALEEIKKVNVGINSGRVLADNNNRIHVMVRGNYDDIDSKLKVIDATTDSIIYVSNEAISGITIHNDQAYLIESSSSNMMQMDLNSLSITNTNLIDGSNFETLFGMFIDPVTGDIYCFDAHGYVVTGTVFCFSNTGNPKHSFQAGLNPGHGIFVK